MIPPSVVRARAYAKVNLALEVLGRRDDGFHEIVSVAQTISLHDLVECRPAEALRVRTEPPVVPAEENLVARAAERLALELGRRPAADVRIRKRIPLASGLGGGSSDAAAALAALRRLWGADLSRVALLRLAAEIGSDVPLFAIGGAVLVRGRGDRVEPLGAGPRVWFAVACPSYNIADKTRVLYRTLRPADWSDGARTLALADQMARQEPVVGGCWPNAFLRCADEVYSGFPDLRRRLAEAAGMPLRLSGAGPSLFAAFATRSDAAAAADRMRALDVACHVASSVYPREVGPPAVGPDRRSTRWGSS